MSVLFSLPPGGPKELVNVGLYHKTSPDLDVSRRSSTQGSELVLHLMNNSSLSFLSGLCNAVLDGARSPSREVVARFSRSCPFLYAIHLSKKPGSSSQRPRQPWALHPAEWCLVLLWGNKNTTLTIDTATSISTITDTITTILSSHQYFLIAVSGQCHITGLLYRTGCSQHFVVSLYCWTVWVI